MNAPVKLKGEDWRSYLHPVTRAKLPGKSEILDNLGWATEGLMGYAFHCARDGKNPWADRDFKADTGTLAHLFIEQEIRCEEIKAPEGVHPEMMQLALVGLCAWRAWRAGKTVEVIAVECPLVDGALGYGTTLDAVLRVDGRLAIFDWKIGKLHDEMVIAAAAMWSAWNKNNPEQIHEVIFVRCPTDGTEAVEVRVSGEALLAGAAVFIALLAIESLKSKIKLPAPVAEVGF